MEEEVKETTARSKILAAARKVFAEQGFDGASMQEISEAAGVNKSLLFYYFNSKNNLYNEILQDIHKKFYKNVMQEKEGVTGIREQLARLIWLYTKGFSENRDIARIMIRSIIGVGPALPMPLEELLDTVRRPLKELIQEGIRQGVLVEVNPDYIVNAIIGILHIFYRIPCEAFPEFDDEAIFNNTMQLLQNGIFTRS